MRRKLFIVPILLALLLTQLACPEGKKLAPYAEDIVESLNASLPLLAPYPELSVRVVNAVTIGRQLVTALKSEGGGDAGNLVDSLITHFDQIVSQVNSLPIPQERKNQILLGLIGARIALGVISRNIAEKAPEGVQQVSKVREFSKRKLWRCRSSQTGRFAEMSFCKAHPDVSVIETY